MQRLKKMEGKRKQPSRASEATFTAVCNLLIAGKSTREENKVAVRHLLREASRSLERSR
jgi:hypothetical protein